MSLFSRDLYNFQRSIDRMMHNMHHNLPFYQDELGITSGDAMDLDWDYDFLPVSSLVGPSFLSLGPSNSGATVNNEKGQSSPQGGQQQQGKDLATKGDQQMQTTGAGGLQPFALARQWNTAISRMNVDMVAHPDSYVLKIDAPGIDKTSLDITIDQKTRTLTIKAEKKVDHKETGPQVQDAQQESQLQGQGQAQAGSGKEVQQQPRVVRSERFFGSMSRSIKLATDSDLTHVGTAKYENGVITLSVPRRKEDPEKDAHRYKKIELA